MTDMLRCRVDKTLLRRVHKVADEMGTSTSELVRIFLKAVAKTGQLPFVPREDSQEDEMLGPLGRRREMLDYFSEH
jgi:addiction module RelB/DinJ family antitoxin